MANILIIGGGFAGLVAAEKLGPALSREHQITLVAPSRKFTFYPANVQLAFGECEVDDITFDLAGKLGELGVRFVEGELIRVDPARRLAYVSGDDINGSVEYDIIVFAMGRRLATEKVPGFFENAHHLLGTGAAQRFGQAVEKFAEGTIVLGSCPGSRLPVPVCEVAFALARRFKDEIDRGSVRVKVIFPGSLRDAFGGAEIHNELETAFAKWKVSMLYDVPVNEITADEVLSAEKHRINYDLLMMFPPFRGQAILDPLGITDDEDFIKVDGGMRVFGMDDAYAIGDIVAFSGPKFAHMAVRQAEVAASNIISRLAGKEEASEYYHEIAAVIDAGGADSIYLHYGIWDDALVRLKKGSFWSIAKEAHDAFWRARHR